MQGNVRDNKATRFASTLLNAVSMSGSQRNSAGAWSVGAAIRTNAMGRGTGRQRRQRLSRRVLVVAWLGSRNLRCAFAQ